MSSTGLSGGLLPWPAAVTSQYWLAHLLLGLRVEWRSSLSLHHLVRLFKALNGPALSCFCTCSRGVPQAHAEHVVRHCLRAGMVALMNLLVQPCLSALAVPLLQI